jgi:hypothetical protein
MIIYQTTNLINGKKYIGRDAWNKPSYLGGGKAIKAAIEKYGKENFKKEILEECTDRTHLLERELYWLNHFNVVNNPDYYNMMMSSDGWEQGKPRPERIGVKLSEMTRKRISENGKGKTGKTSGKPIPIVQYRYEIIKIPIAEYPSASEAAKQTGIKAGDIRSVIRGNQFTAGGFIWEDKID